MNVADEVAKAMELERSCPHEDIVSRHTWFDSETATAEFEIECRTCGLVWRPIEGTVILDGPTRTTSLTNGGEA